MDVSIIKFMSNNFGILFIICKKKFYFNLISTEFLVDALQQGASQFEQQAGKLKRKFWLQNLKVSEKFETSRAIKIFFSHR